MKAKWPNILAAVMLGIGLWITRSPRLVDETAFTWPLVGGALVFVGWWCAVLGWGSFISRKWGAPEWRPYARAALSLAFGSLWAYFSTFVWMLLPAGVALKVGAILWSLAGLALARFEWPGRKANAAVTVLAGIVGFAVFFQLLGGVHLQRNGDPFLVYLTSARLWFEGHGFAPFRESPVQLMAASWDALNLWGMLLLGGHSGEGLAEVQRFAQWMSAGVSYAGLALVLRAFFEDDEESSPGRAAWIWIAVIVGLSIPSLRWIANLAKNDLGIVFWTLAAILAIGRRAFWGGLLLGAAVIGKPTAVVVAFPIVCVEGWRAYQKGERLSRWFGLVVAGGFLGALPILLRNFYVSGNPFYPWLNGLFQSSLVGPTLARGFAAATASGPSLSLALVWEYLREIVEQSPLLIFSLVPLVALKGRALALIGWVSALLFCVFVRKNVEVRYLGPALPLLAALGVASLGEIIEGLAQRLPRARKLFAGASITGVALWSLGASAMPFFLLLQLDSRHFFAPSTQVLEHSGGRAKAWLRKNAAPAELTLSIGDNEIYYAPPARLKEVHYDPVIDRAFDEAKTADKMVAWMKANDVRYFYVLPYIASLTSRSYLSELEPVLKANSHCIRYEEDEARIYEVACLK